ncbi:MAG: hypothetical protein HS108_03265 [Planctomycetes bacterium]|jgi:hypothetical protein|nr:hypothetical protein [Planctomycetota bacterium]MCL4728921.1 hypothetical protein [Planctomycetota bacterium]
MRAAPIHPVSYDKLATATEARRRRRRRLTQLLDTLRRRAQLEQALLHTRTPAA